ncbi:MAG TPA: pyridoxamine 5'-phosphate oxidase family protein [Gaiellaceae bacterium]|nr:pyridoxamine 5'-phosphate oxidase family protein [Gaiellaceae bacterium]
MSSDLLRSIVDKNPYMTLATADEEGTPWATPVWYATADYREFVWVSDPDARHSRNLAQRPELGIVIFDSQQRPATGEAVYLSALAELVPEGEIDRCLGLFSTVSRRQELPEWKRADVDPPARLRLYRATATAHYLLTGRDERIAVEVP